MTVKLCKIIPNPFYSWGYRTIQRAMHRVGLHYAPAKFMPNNGDPLMSRWCHWCGMRSHERWYPPGTTLEQRLEHQRLIREQGRKEYST